jgi:hypothetical protein
MIGDGDCGEIGGMEWWNKDWQGKPKYSEKTCPGATLSTTNPTRPDLTAVNAFRTKEVMGKDIRWPELKPSHVAAALTIFPAFSLQEKHLFSSPIFFLRPAIWEKQTDGQTYIHDWQ